MESHLINSGINATKEIHLKRIKYEFENAEIIVLDNIEIGLLKTKEFSDKIEIIQIQILPNFQGKGIGRKIIYSIIEKTIKSNLRLTLSVLKENKAKELYKSLGFGIIESNESSFEMEYIKRT